MVHPGLDLSRKKLDVCLLSDEGAHLDQLAVCAVVESMTGARLAHDTLEARHGARRVARHLIG